MSSDSPNWILYLTTLVVAIIIYFFKNEFNANLIASKLSLLTSKNKTDLSYKNVILPKNYKHSIIIAFTDINYLPTAKRWFARMRQLNYKNLRLYAMDEMAYRKLVRMRFLVESWLNPA